jgi:5-methylcytosine-specific restriction endonuclease McrA
MSAHDQSKLNSQSLCDLLLTLLKESIPDCSRKETDNVCAFRSTKNFAYVYHRPAGLRAYLCIQESEGCNLEMRLSNGAEILIQRRPTGDKWEKATPYYLDVVSEAGVHGAVPLMIYAAEQLKRGLGTYHCPSEECDRELSEGARTTVEVSRIERDPASRRKCIAIFGAICTVCGFDFEKSYGRIGAGFIHVHHLYPLAEAKGRRRVNPRTDLRPVCPNCHEMLHRQRPPYSIEDLQGMIHPG